MIDDRERIGASQSSFYKQKIFIKFNTNSFQTNCYCTRAPSYTSTLSFANSHTCAVMASNPTATTTAALMAMVAAIAGQPQTGLPATNPAVTGGESKEEQPRSATERQAAADTAAHMMGMVFHPAAATKSVLRSMNANTCKLLHTLILGPLCEAHPVQDEDGDEQPMREGGAFEYEEWRRPAVLVDLHARLLQHHTLHAKGLVEALALREAGDPATFQPLMETLRQFLIVLDVAADARGAARLASMPATTLSAPPATAAPDSQSLVAAVQAAASAVVLGKCVVSWSNVMSIYYYLSNLDKKCVKSKSTSPIPDEHPLGPLVLWLASQVRDHFHLLKPVNGHFLLQVITGRITVASALGMAMGFEDDVEEDGDEDMVVVLDGKLVAKKKGIKISLTEVTISQILAALAIASFVMDQVDTGTATVLRSLLLQLKRAVAIRSLPAPVVVAAVDASFTYLRSLWRDRQNGRDVVLGHANIFDHGATRARDKMPATAASVVMNAAEMALQAAMHSAVGRAAPSGGGGSGGGGGGGGGKGGSGGSTLARFDMLTAAQKTPQACGVGTLTYCSRWRCGPAVKKLCYQSCNNKVHTDGNAHGKKYHYCKRKAGGVEFHAVHKVL